MAKRTDTKAAEHLPAEIDKALEPYGLNQPYSLSLRIQQAKWLLKQQVNIHFALGCVLTEIKERENLQTFVNTLTDEFGGMSQATAYHYMLFARKCMELPKIREFAEGNWSKALALLHSNTDEQLLEIERNGLDGKALDEYDGMSVAEFKAKLREQKQQLADADASAHAKYKKEIRSLQAQVSASQKGVSPKEAEKLLAEIEEAAHRLDDMIGGFLLNPALVGHDALKAKAAGIYVGMETRFRKFNVALTEYLGAGVKK